MSHMFCTLQEAAQTLNASEDQIRALLEKGLLQEFREGPHCLLREADVGALARKQRQRRARPSPAPSQTQAGQPSPSRDPRAQMGRPAEIGLPRSARTGSRPSPVPGPQDGERSRPPRAMNVPGRPGMSHLKAHAAHPPRAQETAPRRPAPRPSGGLSLRQWFWMGLVQDRPSAIALLSGLVLSLLAALVGGLWFLAQVA